MIDYNLTKKFAQNLHLNVADRKSLNDEETNGVVLAKLQSWAGDFPGRLSLQEEDKGRK